ncbi:MAG TPA: hypothetical protein PLK30_08705 [Blastocatellia bacterium]|nr:hypothetical protein [Blastocatellia bacterium]
MRDEGFGRFGNLVMRMEAGRGFSFFVFFAAAQIGQRLNDQTAQLFRRFELTANASGTGAIFQFGQFPLGFGVGFDIAGFDRMVFVHQENQNRDAAFDGSIEFQFGVRDIVTGRYFAVANAENADVNVCVVYHFAVYGDGVCIADRQLLHAVGENAFA